MRSDTARSSDRNLALVAARNGRCPECEMTTCTAAWGERHGREVLIEVSCMSCPYHWPTDVVETV